MNEPPEEFARYRTRAAMLIRSPAELRALTVRAAGKLTSGGAQISDRLRAVRDELETLLALLRAWVEGEYREVSTRTLITIAAGVLYFVVPLDLVTDFIAGLGLLDDAAVIGYVAGMVREELVAFETWRKNGRKK
ncbi:MAG: YkvA family protein [Gammaproteobacteria bacterium]|nr:YkvA family protein [Gammaproteobacteria bacterium]